MDTIISKETALRSKQVKVGSAAAVRNVGKQRDYGEVLEAQI